MKNHGRKKVMKMGKQKTDMMEKNGKKNITHMKKKKKKKKKKKN